MKNDSFFHPFSTPIDSCFDSNNDGELTGFETAFRDAALMDSYNHFNEDNCSSFNDSDSILSDFDDDDINNYEFRGSYAAPYTQMPKSEIPEGKFITTAFTDNSKKDYSNPPSDSTVLWSSIGVVAIIIGAFAIILSQETRDDLLNAIVIFFSVALSVGLLKITGVIASNKKNVESDDEIDDADSYYNAVNDCFNYDSNDRNE